MTTSDPNMEPLLPGEGLPHTPLTPEFRAEAMLRLHRDVVFAERDSGGIGVEGQCLVPSHVVMPGTNQIDPAKNTYQKVMINGVSYQAHSAILALVLNRHLEKDEVGMHLCNNPACRNPTHIKLGTMKDNMEYAVACKRIASGERNGHVTCPEKTPQGETHYNNRLKGERLETALSLLKKYDAIRGAVGAIAAYIGTTTGTLYNLTRNKRHLAPDVGDTDIELEIKKWVPRDEKPPEPVKPDLEKVVREIRQRFHETPDYNRAIMLEVLAKVYDYTPTWIRKIVKRDVYRNIAQDIPVPENMGIGTRCHPKKNQEDK